MEIHNNLAITTLLNAQENPVKIRIPKQIYVEPVDINEVNFIGHMETDNKFDPENDIL